MSYFCVSFVMNKGMFFLKYVESWYFQCLPNTGNWKFLLCVRCSLFYTCPILFGVILYAVNFQSAAGTIWFQKGHEGPAIFHAIL